MKVVLSVLAALTLVCCGNNVNAQIKKDSYKNRSEMMKLNKKLQKEENKVSKDIKNQAKNLQKDGWAPLPGTLSMEQQYNRAALFDNSFEDDDITPRYVSGLGTSIGSTLDAARMQAMELARVDLIGNMESDITKLVENNVSNKQLSDEDAVSVVNTMISSKSLVSKKIGQTTPVIQIYKKLPNGNYQVSIRTFYSMEKARQLAKEVLRQELEKENAALQEKLTDILGY